MYCRKCGAEIPDDSVFCPICAAQLLSVEINEQETKENSECENTCPKGPAPKTEPKETTTQATSSAAPKLKKHMVLKVVVGALLILLIICSEGFRSLLGIAALFAVPVSLVVFIIQAIRKKAKKKWGIVCIVAISVGVVFILTDSSFQEGFQNGKVSNEIVGEWVGCAASINDGDLIPISDLDEYATSCNVKKMEL